MAACDSTANVSGSLVCDRGCVSKYLFHVFENQWPMNITLVQSESDIQKYDLVRRDIRDRKR